MKHISLLVTLFALSLVRPALSQGGAADLFTAIHRLQKMLHSLRTKLATNH